MSSTIDQLYNNLVTLISQTFAKQTDIDSSVSSHNTNSSAHSTQMAKKVNVSQGSSKANKNVVTDSSGNITTEAKPTIPTKTSDLTNDGDGTNVFVKNNDTRLSDSRTPTSHSHGNVSNEGKIGTANGKIVTTGTGGVLQASDSITKSQISDFPTTMTPASHTHGNLQNDGIVKVSGTVQKTKNLVTDGNGYITAEAKPTIPSASSTTPSADTASGSVGSGTTWAKADHTHPKSTLYAEASHSHSYNDLSNKPTIPEAYTHPSTKQCDAAAGTHSHSEYNKATYSQTVASTDTGAYEIGKITVDGTETTLYGKDTDTVYSHPSTVQCSHAHGNITSDGKVGSSANYFVYTTTSGKVTSKQKIGNITTSGAIGSTSGLPLKTTTSGVITTGSFGTTSGTFCQGNDSRLHTHTFSYSSGSLEIT